MVQERQPQVSEKAVWWYQVKLWSVAAISIALLSACFIVSCVVTYFTYGKTDQRLSALHTYHSSLTCFSEGTRVTGFWSNYCGAGTSGEKNMIASISSSSHHLGHSCNNWSFKDYLLEAAMEKVWGCCPSTWKSFDSSCYFIPSEQNFWTKSEQHCIKMGAHLVVINTIAEQNFIAQQLNKSLSYFLGLSDPQGNGNWQWIDQTPYTDNVRLWHQDEPNFSAEECASLVFWNHRGWGWNDVFCDSKRNSICEMKKIYF